MLGVFIYIFAVIGFGIEEILHEQRESDKRIRKNLEAIKGRR